ncbi:hypothetical protein BC834DRAFT_910592 [Gloeopeniophorella convolvens]|nr:hypothetical protein BC834DRAFT_910592 [Gloeopeniophorella convolvens]
MRSPVLSVLHQRFNAGIQNTLATLVGCILSLASNLWAFGLVAWKAWSRRRLVGELHNEGFCSSAAGRALVLLLESGAVYSLIWALVIATFSVSSTDSHAIRRMAIGDDVLLTVMVYVSAVYPIAIWLIVAVKSRARGENPSLENASGTAVTGPLAQKSLAGVLEELLM